MVTEKVVGVASATTGVAAPLVGQMFDAFELKLIACLLGIISLLMSLVLKFMWDMRKDNRSDHKELYAKTDELSTAAAHLQGEHDASFQARGCAYDKKRLQEYIVESMKEVLEERRCTDEPLQPEIGSSIPDPPP